MQEEQQEEQKETKKESTPKQPAKPKTKSIDLPISEIVPSMDKQELEKFRQMEVRAALAFLHKFPLCGSHFVPL